ncbi:MAG: RDD family protein [Candidatus Thiodiazotropha sp. (ex. Lucinisca nassula)]|nr:RDD family protein [Candidatus Thiodiazotropha sp. (ex. Lucinisca nassula)]MBW9275837.1 RDD family protein [Candidatus Thiodiazotropha sp. (ex. Lucinisca nassula)]
MYPRLLRRIQAVLIDSVITPIVLFVSVFIVGIYSIDSDFIRGLLSLGPALSMEPLLVATTGGTIGHHIIGIKVRHVNEDRYITIFHAIFRFILKVLLGLPSLIFILTTRRHQAIHDLLSQSIVVHKSTDNLASNEALEERDNEIGYIYPRAIKRVLVIFTYIILITALISVMVRMSVSTNCLELGLCNSIDSTISYVAPLIFWSATYAVIVMGWNSRLYGCRRVCDEDAYPTNSDEAKNRAGNFNDKSN